MKLVYLSLIGFILTSCVDGLGQDNISIQPVDSSNSQEENDEQNNQDNQIDISIGTTDINVDEQSDTQTQITTPDDTELPVLPDMPVTPSNPNEEIDSNTNVNTDTQVDVTIPVTLPEIPQNPTDMTDTQTDTQTQTDSEGNTEIPQEIEISQNCQSDQYVAGTTYLAGELVLNKQSAYECKISGWCSSEAAFAYEPGVGFGWTEAWEFVENCDAVSSTNPVITDTQTQTDTGVEIQILPQAPSNVQLSFANSQVAINFEDNSSNETKFEVYRSVNSQSYVKLTDVSANQTQIIDSDFQDGQTLIYIVRAVKNDLYSDFSDPVFITIDLNQNTDTDTQEDVSLPPQVPSGVLLQKLNDSVEISFVDNSDNETGFEIYRSVNANAYEKLATLSANVANYQDLDVQAPLSLIYIVRAVNDTLYSDFTAPATIELEQESEETSEDLALLKSVYDDKCLACHQAQGFGGDLEEPSTKAQLINNGYESLLSKTKTMPVQNCDDECFEQAANYVWKVLYEQQLEVAAGDSIGVRGIRLLTPYEYQNTIKDILNVTVLDSQLPKIAVTHEFKFDNEADSGVMLYEDVNEYYLLAKTVSAQYNSNLNLQNYLSLAKKLFRSDLTSEESSLLTDAYNDYSLQEAVELLLNSPKFLYRLELGVYDANLDAYKLTDFEVATALAYQIWGTTPNDWLLNLASTNSLNTASQIQSAANTMLDDEKFSSHFVHFLSFYTKAYDELYEKPGLSQDVIDAMLQERVLATKYLFENGSSSIDELFNPEYTYVNSTLASHYDISNSSSSMVKVNVDENRGGLLHQGLTQIANSDFTSTSLVKRGKMIRENMMCHTMGVPSGVDPSDIELPDYAVSTIERWDIITGPDASEGQCWKCHQLMNEPGSALESFDAAGRFRVEEIAYNNENVMVDIEPTGVLRDNTGFIDLMSYDNTRSLSEYLSSNEDTRKCFADNLYRFGFGHTVDSQVSESFDQVAQNFAQSGNIKSLILDLVLSQPFLYRADR